jgi:hypothetical protein
MKILGMITVALIATAASECGEVPPVREDNSQYWSVDYRIVHIDGCDYIANKGNGSETNSLVHKGNCPNPQHGGAGRPLEGKQ